MSIMCAKQFLLDYNILFFSDHLEQYVPTVDSACQIKNQAMRLKELSVEVRDRIVLRHRSGEGYQNISAEHSGLHHS